MPSEGHPLLIDTATIAVPADVPLTALSLMAHRREIHLARALGSRQDLGPTTNADPLAALALDVAITRRAAEDQPHLVQAALEQGSSWEEIAAALDVSAASARSTFARDDAASRANLVDDGTDR